MGRAALRVPALGVRAGTTHLSLGAAGVAPGAYVLRVVAPGGTLTQRVAVAR